MIGTNLRCNYCCHKLGTGKQARIIQLEAITRMTPTSTPTHSSTLGCCPQLWQNSPCDILRLFLQRMTCCQTAAMPLDPRHWFATCPGASRDQHWPRPGGQLATRTVTHRTQWNPLENPLESVPAPQKSSMSLSRRSTRFRNARENCGSSNIIS